MQSLILIVNALENSQALCDMVNESVHYLCITFLFSARTPKIKETAPNSETTVAICATVAAILPCKGRISNKKKGKMDRGKTFNHQN